MNLINKVTMNTIGITFLSKVNERQRKCGQ